MEKTLVTYVQSKNHDLRIQTMWEYPKVCVNLQTDVK